MLFFWIYFLAKNKKVMKSSLWHEAFDKAFDIIYTVRRINFFEIEERVVDGCDLMVAK